MNLTQINEVTSSYEPVVYDRGNPRLDAVVDFAASMVQSMALTSFLDEAPAKIASIFAAPICSLYLLEPTLEIHDSESSDRPLDSVSRYELVMRGNVGFPAVALGDIRLRVGEGITGMAVALEKPISTNEASRHMSYRYFSQLGEENFPVFLCAPIMGSEGALGAVTVQHKTGHTISTHDVELLVALAASLAQGVMRADLLDQIHTQSFTRGPGGGTRRITLPGRPFRAGRAIGAIAALRRPASKPRSEPYKESTILVPVAFEVALRAVELLHRKSQEIGIGQDAEFLQTYIQILEDQRFLERTLEWIELKKSVGAGFGEVAREVVRMARWSGDAFHEQRARDIEDLCDALVMLVAADARAEMPTRPVVIGDRLTVYDLLISARYRPAAIALSEQHAAPRTKTLVSLLGVPCVIGVQGLFRWASDGDIALVDGDHGFVVINPPRSDVQQVRADR